MTIDVQALVVVLGLIGTLGGFIAAFYKLFARFSAIEKQSAHRKEDSEILLKTLLGVLDGLIEQGCNGPCKKARDELIAYMAER